MGAKNKLSNGDDQAEAEMSVQGGCRRVQAVRTVLRCERSIQPAPAIQGWGAWRVSRGSVQARVTLASGETPLMGARAPIKGVWV
jgi:hypothetical protein